eukprot:TRINITY_DN16551_c0_g1_i1.p1 TRINITY_DN16551_c0_g1~~TRINITY_DN16551_c0_g1_i1.p1  ORF type:complete len:462 (+),score=131.55 TRINITY_DN16551_c0_g1_i1:111-1388(+)
MAGQTVYRFDHARDSVRRDPVLSRAQGLVLGCGVGHHTAAVVTTSRRGVCCSDPLDQTLSFPEMPWPAAAVSAGYSFCSALRRGGHGVCTWGISDASLGRLDDKEIGEVCGLPMFDPVVILESGGHFSIAVTNGGKVFGWGHNEAFQLGVWDPRTEQAEQIAQAQNPQTVQPLSVQPTPLRLRDLEGRGLRSIACGGSFAYAEVRGGVMWWGCHEARDEFEVQPNWVHGFTGTPIEFPLRNLVAGTVSAAAVGAAGDVYQLRGRGVFRARVPEPVLVAAAAANYTTVALAESGVLWDCTVPSRCRSITHAHGLPLGLVPRGGAAADTIVMISSCDWIHRQGSARARILLVIAMRCAREGRPLLPNLGWLTGGLLAGFIHTESFMVRERPVTSGFITSAHIIRWLIRIAPVACGVCFIAMQGFRKR